MKHHSSYWINVDLTDNKQLCDYGLKKKGWSEIRIDNRVYAIPRVEASVIRSIIANSGVDYSHIIVQASHEVSLIMQKARKLTEEKKSEVCVQTFLEEYTEEGT